MLEISWLARMNAFQRFCGRRPFHPLAPEGASQQVKIMGFIQSLNNLKTQ